MACAGAAMEMAGLLCLPVRPQVTAGCGPGTHRGRAGCSGAAGEATGAPRGLGLHAESTGK